MNACPKELNGTQKILMVDDEPPVVKIVTRMLAPIGCDAPHADGETKVVSVPFCHRKRPERAGAGANAVKYNVPSR